MPHYAHSLEGRPTSEWEPLEEHLQRVAELAEEFAGRFGAAEWGRVAGLWHDVGKYREEFQQYLRGTHSSVEHAGVGAVLAQSIAKHQRSRHGASLCFAIAGHHAGLANSQSNESAQSLGLTSLPAPLSERLTKNRPVFERLEPTLPLSIVDHTLPDPPAMLVGAGADELNRSIEFWTRMLFSALVDADRLATRAFYAQFEPTLLSEDLEYDNLTTLGDRLDAHIDQLAEPDSTPVNRLRADVLDACRVAAEQSPGRYSMTVPTGGGKTLSAMSFALRHAVRHGLRRVVVVIPFTSIIEQNAKIYREVLGADNVLEHHSNLDEARLEELDFKQESRRKLAAENWDAPVVVTTSVQFFESLFTNHPSRCRKLHNISRSVVILDEVQTLPPQLLRPILDGLAELTARYGCSVVFSTATPPALARHPKYGYGLSDVAEIVPDPLDLARRARRVHVTWDVETVTEYDALATRLAAFDKVLAIVHRRRDARELSQHVQREAGRDALFHLSALMCPAHRIDVLEQVRKALNSAGSCRVVSTQLIEAGVDVDFPVVFRAVAGMDSLAQAAGRCDREGRLTAANGGQPGGRLFVYRAPTPPPPGVLRKAMESTLSLIRIHDGLDFFEPSTCEAFFRDLYAKHDLDDRGIQRDRQNLDFATVALKFRMIDTGMRPIVVPYADSSERVARFRDCPARSTQRALQPYLVQVSPTHHAALVGAGALETIHDRVDVLVEPFWNRYDDRFGLDPDMDGVMDPEVMVC